MEEAQGDKDASEGTSIASSYYFRSKEGDHLHQGQLLLHVWEWDIEYDDAGKPSGARPRIHKLAVIVTQECDLLQDFSERIDDSNVETELRSVLFCPVEPAEELRDEHRSKGRTDFSTRRWEVIKLNKAERYQYLSDVPLEADAGAKGHKSMLVDFKNYFTVRTVELYRQIRAVDEDSATLFTALNIPWREHLQQRFASYQARVGLPRDHFIPEGRSR